MANPKLLFSREEMTKMNIETLKQRGVSIDEIALISFNQQSKYTKDVSMDVCVESVIKVLSYRDIFHHVQLGAEIDRLTEEKLFKGPIQDILYHDLGLFGIDEVLGLDISGIYGVIGKTNFGDVDINKPGIVDKLNEEGKKEGHCHTFMDDIVGAIAAAASTRVAQVMNEELAKNK
ncbi:MAG: phosphatidylglycerophosphatase A [bacterium]